MDRDLFAIGPVDSCSVKSRFSALPKFEVIGNAGEVPAGKKKRYRCGLADFLVANVDGVYYAMSNTCSHANELLSDGMLVGRQVVCPAHYAVFDVANGQVVRHPEGANIAPIKTYKVKVEDGRISIEIEN